MYWIINYCYNFLLWVSPASVIYILEKGTEKGWIGIEGVQVLIEQGLWQFEKWTVRRAPRNIIEENVYKKYDM